MPDTVHLMLTVIADDHPGLVKRFADLIVRHSGNWIDSGMARLGGKFAGIVKISVPRQQAADLSAALQALSGKGMDVAVSEDTTTARPLAGQHVRLELVGQDHPGIISDVSGVLAGLGVNVEELHSSLFTGSMSAEAMFRAGAVLTVPETVDLAEVHAALEEIANDIMVDIELTSPGSGDTGR